MKVVTKVVAGALGAALSLMIAGAIYQRRGTKHDRRLMTPGEMVETSEGRRLYALRKGYGTPAIVFESGFSATSLNWRKVQDLVAVSTETVTYDRSGLGWSTGPVAERTPRKIAAELREMLQAAGIPAPYVLVGHSFGGLVMRRFALDYPGEVAGVVLVDPMRTKDWPPVNQSQSAMVANAHRLAGVAIRVAQLGLARLVMRSLLCRDGKIATTVGRVTGKQARRLFERLTEEVGKMPPETRPIVAAHWGNPDFFRGMRAHLDALAAIVEEMHEAPAIEGVPVVVLTPLGAEPLSAEELDKVGKGARQVIAHKSRHWIHLDEPELVVTEILAMLRPQQP